MGFHCELALAPCSWIASVVETRDDCYRVLHRVEDSEQRVGEAKQEQATDLAAMD